MKQWDYNTNYAGVKSVLNRKPLVRAIALALMVAVPTSAWAQVTF